MGVSMSGVVITSDIDLMMDSTTSKVHLDLIMHLDDEKNMN